MKRSIITTMATIVRRFAYVAVAALLVTSCSDNPDKLPAGTVEDLVEDLLKQSGQDQSYVQIPVGTFELNNQNARGMLMKLKAAGVINYDVKRYAWWNKTLSIQNYYRWREYVGPHYERIGSTYYDFEEHFVVTVSLTDAAKKYEVDEIPVAEAKDDTDMKQPDVDFDSFPEAKVSLTEQWPYIPNPEAEPVAGQQVPETVTVDLSEQVEEEDPGCVTDEYDDDAPQRLSLDIETSMAYEEVQAKFNQKMATLKSARLKVKKARFIQVFDNPDSGVRCGSAEIIIEMDEVTDAARVLEKKCNGIRFCSPVNVVYFADKGWVLQDKSLHLQSYSNLGVAVSGNGTITGGNAAEALGNTDEY